MKNQTKKWVAEAMTREAEKEKQNLCEKPTDVFKFVKLMKNEGKVVEGGRCTRGRDGRLGLSENYKGKI